MEKGARRSGGRSQKKSKEESEKENPSRGTPQTGPNDAQNSVQKHGENGHVGLDFPCTFFLQFFELFCLFREDQPGPSRDFGGGRTESRELFGAMLKDYHPARRRPVPPTTDPIESPWKEDTEKLAEEKRHRAEVEAEKEKLKKEKIRREQEGSPEAARRSGKGCSGSRTSDPSGQS